MARPAPLDSPAPATDGETTLRLPPVHAVDTAVMHRLPDYWPALDPDAEATRARSVLRQRTAPPVDVLHRVLDGLRALT